VFSDLTGLAGDFVVEGAVLAGDFVVAEGLEVAAAARFGLFFVAK
jgi:hypothetical protein